MLYYNFLVPNYVLFRTHSEDEERRRRGGGGDEGEQCNVVSSQFIPGGYGERAPTGYNVSNPL